VRAFRASLVVTLCLLCFAGSADAGFLSRGAGGFFGSVGVDTHLTFADTSYGDWSRLVGLLGVLGVRHLSDGAYGNPAASWAGFNALFDGRVELAASRGLRFAFDMGEPGYRGGSIGQLVSVMSGPLRNSIEAIEDPNEFDNAGLSDWSGRLASYDRRLFAAVKASPSLRSLPVIGPSLVGDDSPRRLGDQQSWLNFGNIHPYTGGTAPTPAYIASQLRRIGAVSGSKQVWATELGYSTALKAPVGEEPVSEYVGAVYLLRELLENFKAGIRRTYIYELIDDFRDPGDANIQDHYGLLRANYTPKPAFTALKNLLSIVGRQSPSKLSALKLSVTQGPDDLRQLVLQQAPHTYLLVLWRLASVWDTTSRRPITVPAAKLSLRLPNATTAATADPLTTSTLRPQPITHGQLQTTIAANPLTIQIKTH
jgi:hypothetical protein